MPRPQYFAAGLALIAIFAVSGCSVPKMMSGTPQPDWIKQGSGAFDRNGHAVLQGVNSFNDPSASPEILTQAADDYAEARLSKIVDAYMEALTQSPEGMITVSGNMSGANISPTRSISLVPTISSSSAAATELSTGAIANPPEIAAILASSDTDTDTLSAPEQVRLSGWDMPGAACGHCAPQSPVVPRLIAGGKDQVVAEMTLNTQTGDSQWRGLKIDRWTASISRSQTGKYVPSLALNNKASDVANIKVWIDMDHDGLLEPSRDALISRAGRVYNFPTTALARSLGAKDASPEDVYVVNARKLYPPGNPFTGDTFERLALNDEQTDETKKEIVVCTGGVDFSSNVFHHCYRAQEETAEIALTTGTSLSGPARIPIIGATGAGGQIISSAPISVFVTYDLSPSATISAQARLGLIIANADYFLMTLQKPADGQLPDEAASKLQAAARAQLHSNTKVADHWTAPSGALYSLCILDVSDFNKSLEEYPGLGELASQYVHLNADKALQSVLQKKSPQPQ